MVKPVIKDPEIEAMNTIYNLLADLPEEVAEKVLIYTIERFKPALLERPATPPQPPAPNGLKPAKLD